MPYITWSENALRDIYRLADFLAGRRPSSARKAVKAIRAGVRLLATHPQLGHPVADLPEPFREWIVVFGRSAYVIRYRVEEGRFIVLAIRHGREAG